MSAPAEIWIDERVVRTMKTEPDLDAAGAGVEQLRYVSHERLAELLLQSSGGAEFFIQIWSPWRRADELLALTNFGRIYTYSFEAETWTSEIGVPDFGVPAGS